MSEPDRRIAELFAADEPPARDTAFVLLVIERVERARLWLNLAWLALLTIAGGSTLWVLAPLFTPALADTAAVLAPVMLPVTAAGVLAGAVWMWSQGRPVLARG